MDYKKIKRYEDACKALRLEPISDESYNRLGQDAKTMAAYHKLAVITRAINDGWQPDWSNHREDKWEPYMYTNNAGLVFAYTYSAPSDTHTAVGSRLCFHDYERAAYAVKTFGETLYKDYFRPEDYKDEEKPGAAEEKKQNTESENGGDEVERDIDDLSDAPDFLQKVGKIVIEQIHPLAEADRENRAIILISVEDNYTDKDGDTGCACTVGMVGSTKVLAKGLADFLKNEKTQDVIKLAYLRVKLGKLVDTGVKAFKEIFDSLK